MTAAAITAAYVLLGVGLVLLGLLGTRSDRFPTFGQVFSLLMEPPFGRWVILFGWWWLGWHFFVRGS